MNIKACPNCGSLNIQMSSFYLGGIPGIDNIAGISICQDCKYRGLAIEFGSEKKYLAFLKEMKKKK